MPDLTDGPGSGRTGVWLSGNTIATRRTYDWAAVGGGGRGRRCLCLVPLSPSGRQSSNAPPPPGKGWHCMHRDMWHVIVVRSLKKGRVRCVMPIDRRDGASVLLMEWHTGGGGAQWSLVGAPWGSAWPPRPSAPGPGGACAGAARAGGSAVPCAGGTPSRPAAPRPGGGGTLDCVHPESYV